MRWRIRSKIEGGSWANQIDLTAGEVEVANDARGFPGPCAAFLLYGSFGFLLLAHNVGSSRRRDLSGAGGRRAVYVASHRRSVPMV
jgi:hypothetical protein